jgi:hypothetical protein
MEGIKMIEDIKNIKVNDIYYTSWGYDQTNYDYCKVIGKSNKSLKCIMIKMNIIKQVGFMSNEVEPNPNFETGKPFRIICKGNNSFIGSYPFCEGYDSKRMGYWSKYDIKQKCIDTNYA